MKKIIRHLRDYVVTLNKAVFLFASLFTALTIFINYRYGLNKTIYRLDEPWQFAGWYAVFLIAFGFGHILQAIFLRSSIFKNKKFIALLFIAPAIFAWKMVADIRYDLATDFLADEYWNAVIYWPFKVIVIVCMLYLVHRFFDKGQPFYGA